MNIVIDTAPRWGGSLPTALRTPAVSALARGVQAGAN